MSNKPLIGLPWREDIDSKTYTYICIALDAMGIDHVMLPRVTKEDLLTGEGRLRPECVSENGSLELRCAEMLKNDPFTGSNVAEAAAGVDAIIFTGGDDISPSLYRVPEAWHGIKEETSYYAERDVNDYILMRYCLEHDIHAIGICRGMQMIAVASGAEMIQDIPTYLEKLGLTYDHRHRAVNERPGEYRDFTPHDIEVIDSGSRIAKIMGFAADSRMIVRHVPSWHHQAVKSVEGTGLKITAMSVRSAEKERIDNALTPESPEMIECIESTRHSYIVGYQFHPEAAIAKRVGHEPNADTFMNEADARSLFLDFAEHVAGSRKR